jgi:hypothetical protein
MLAQVRISVSIMCNEAFQVQITGDKGLELRKLFNPMGRVGFAGCCGKAHSLIFRRELYLLHRLHLFFQLL